MPTPEQMTAAVQAYVDAFEKGDPDAVAALFAEQCTVEDPVGTPVHNGLEAVRAVPQLHFAPERGGGERGGDEQEQQPVARRAGQQAHRVSGRWKSKGPPKRALPA